MEGIDGKESDRLHARNIIHDKNNINPHNIKKAIDSNKICLTHQINTIANIMNLKRPIKNVFLLSPCMIFTVYILTFYSTNFFS